MKNGNGGYKVKRTANVLVTSLDRKSWLSHEMNSDNCPGQRWWRLHCRTFLFSVEVGSYILSGSKEMRETCTLIELMSLLIELECLHVHWWTHMLSVCTQTLPTIYCYSNSSKPRKDEKSGTTVFFQIIWLRLCLCIFIISYGRS